MALLVGEQLGESMACSWLKCQTHVGRVDLDAVKGLSFMARHLGFTLWRKRTMVVF